MDTRSPHLVCFRPLVVTGCEGMDLAAPFVRKLQREVAQTADADHANSRVGRNAVCQKRREDCDAAAKQRPRFLDVESLGQWARPRPLNAEAIGKCSVPPNDRALDACAEMVIARETVVAEETAGRGPADADTLAKL